MRNIKSLEDPEVRQKWLDLMVRDSEFVEGEFEAGIAYVGPTSPGYGTRLLLQTESHGVTAYTESMRNLGNVQPLAFKDGLFTKNLPREVCLSVETRALEVAMCVSLLSLFCRIEYAGTLLFFDELQARPTRPPSARLRWGEKVFIEGERLPRDVFGEIHEELLLARNGTV